VSEQEFRRALGYANSAMDLLQRAYVPPYPQFYELLYTYATGVNPALNARINSIFREGDPSADITERLYNEFIKADTANARVSGVTERMSSRIETMNDAIDSAMTTANAYSASLQTAAGDLNDGIDSSRLAILARHLLSETRRMQEANHELEMSLEASREDISALQRDLEDVRREALLDPLTKIYNRKAFDDGLVKEVNSAATGVGAGLCLMLLDIDHFKGFNDTWGHQTGDQVLRLVAMTLKSNIKGKDLAARYGGEEFAAILPDTDLAGATALAESIRRAIQAKELLKRSTNEKLGRVTASFGIAQFRLDDTPSSLIERADRCLYAAKHRGRNIVVVETDIIEDEIVAA
jgi:diguanylate cyclase